MDNHEKSVDFPQFQCPLEENLMGQHCCVLVLRFDCRLSLVRHSFRSFVEGLTGRLNDRQPPDLGCGCVEWSGGAVGAGSVAQPMTWALLGPLRALTPAQTQPTLG